MAQRRMKVRVGEIRKLSEIQASEPEAAGVLGISLKTFREMLRLDARAREAWEFGRAKGKVSLRRRQFALSKTSAPVAIWLGRHWLGQNEVSTVELTGANGGPIQSVDLTKLTPEQRRDLRNLLSAIQVKKES